MKWHLVGRTISMEDVWSEEIVATRAPWQYTDRFEGMFEKVWGSTVHLDRLEKLKESAYAIGVRYMELDQEIRAFWWRSERGSERLRYKADRGCLLPTRRILKI